MQVSFLFQEDYDRLRVISYMNCDVFLVCFSVINRQSLVSVENHWIPEIKHYLPKTPYILVATQTDRREDFDLSLNRVRLVTMFINLLSVNLNFS